jgi:sporulation protein YlmC with PRC-barrel domain
MRLSGENLRGRSVIASDGLLIGEVALLFVDSEAWHVESVQVRLRKEVAVRLGAGRSIFRAPTLEIPTSMIQSVGDTVVLSVAIDGLRQVLSGAEESAAAH